MGYQGRLTKERAKKMAKKLSINGAGKTDIHTIPAESLDEIFIDDFNPRKNIGDNPEDEDLYNYVMSGGYVPPLTGFVRELETGEEVFVLQAGHRRLWALKKAISNGLDIKNVQVIKLRQKNLNRFQAIANAMAENNGKPLTKTEKSAAIVTLRNGGWSFREIASNIGLSETKVRDLASLDTLIPELKEEVDKGGLPESEARQIAKKSGGDVNKQETAFLNVEEEKETGKRTQTGRKKYEPVSAETEEARIDVYEGVLTLLETSMQSEDALSSEIYMTELKTLHKRLNRELKRFIKKQEKISCKG